MVASPQFLDWKSKARYEGRVRLSSSSLTSLRTSNPGLAGINLSQGLCTPLNPHKMTRCTFPHSVEGASRKPALMLRHESALISFSSSEWPEVGLNLQVEFKCPQMWRPEGWRGRKPGWPLYLWSYTQSSNIKPQLLKISFQINIERIFFFNCGLPVTIYTFK